MTTRSQVPSRSDGQVGVHRDKYPLIGENTDTRRSEACLEVQGRQDRWVKGGV